MDNTFALRRKVIGTRKNKEDLDDVILWIGDVIVGIPAK